MQPTKLPIVEASTPSEWNDWLSKNHITEKGVWLIFYTKNAKKKSISWSEAVTEALCFGWIDSKKIRIDSFTSHQYFCPRKAKSTWSKINKEKVAQLIQEGRMSEAGYKSIAIAKENGSWTVLDDIEALIVPQDLALALAAFPLAESYFTSLSKSSKKMLLYWVKSAKREETRQKRIQEIAQCAALQTKPKNF